MIYTLTFYPSVDLYIYTSQFNIGDINHPKIEKFMPGGKGINVSIMLKTLGRSSICLGFMGGLSGKYITQQLDKLKIKHDFITSNISSRINVKISKDNKETAFNVNPINYSLSEYKLLKNKLDKLNKGDYLIISGSMPKLIHSSKFEESLFSSLNKRDINLVVDTSKSNLVKLLKFHPFLIKPNKDELEEIFKVKLKKDNDVIKYSKRLIKLGAKNVVVSLGKDGAILINKDLVFKAKSIKGKVIKTIGCGDSLVAGFIDEYIKTHDLKSSLINGVIVGSASAFSTTLASKKEIDLIKDKYIL